MKHLFVTALLGLAISGSAAAESYTLTFDNEPGTCASTNTCYGSSKINQQYGDIAGVVDVSYGNGNRELYWWDNGYNDLRGVVWAGSSPTGSYGRIEIRPINASVTLNGFDMGAWPNTTRSTHIRITDIGGETTFFSYDGNVGIVGSSLLTNHSNFSPKVSSANGLWINWYDDAYNVGIDNIQFTVAAVPEPETYSLLLAGMGLLGFMARTRKRISAGSH